MKKTLFIITLFIFTKSFAQKSFEGLIKFKTEISSTYFKSILEDKYGDSLIAFYSKDGFLKRKYLNSKSGNDFQIYNPKKGILYLKNNNSAKIDSLDVKKNSIIKLTNRRKIKGEKIMNMKCQCVEYTGISDDNQNVIINYCFSKKTPKIDFRLFENHSDFFLNDYFKDSKRPYLKFSVETDEFKITQTATEIMNQVNDSQIFKMN